MDTMTKRELTLADIPRYDPPDLREVVHIGHFANLAREEYVDHDGGLYLVRWWVNRGGPEDGHRFPVEVEARRCPSGTWFEVGRFGEWENYSVVEG